MNVKIGHGNYRVPIHIKLGQLTVRDIERIDESVSAIGKWLDQTEPAERSALYRRITKPSAQKLCRALREDLFQNRRDVVDSDGRIVNGELFRKLALICAGRGADLIVDRRLDQSSLLAFQLGAFRARSSPADIEYFHLIMVPDYEPYDPRFSNNPWKECREALTDRFYAALGPDEQIEFIESLGACGWVYALASLWAAIRASGTTATAATLRVLREHGYSELATRFEEIAGENASG